MSSMRNAVQRRNYKERAQPKEREKWGLLEKHKDYSLRAKDYNEKKRRLRALRQKAAERNPDEFHFAMMSSRTRNGQKIAERGNQVLSQEATRLYKTQDAGYIRTVLQKTVKMREKLEQAIMVGEDGIANELPNTFEETMARTHINFVGSANEQDQWKSSDGPPSEEPTFATATNEHNHDSGNEEQDDREDVIVEPPRRKNDVAWSEVSSREARVVEKRRKRREQAIHNTLTALRTREKDLRMAESELEVQRAKMNNAPAPMMTKNGVKFKVKERKK